MTARKKYAQVGLGERHKMYRNAITGQFADSCEMVALCDSNEGRLKLSISEVSSVQLPGYKAEDFDKMIAETKPDCVIVTTKDSLHDKYICRAMELGCDVVTEKPMTIDAERCRRILETQKRIGKECRVTFNYRYSPPRTQLKELLMSGVIGDVLSVDFHWLLDTRHGADYFRRWHRNKENSGGLMVHKATHHFDLVNWWLSTVPETVCATGHRKFYTPKTADRYGLINRSERCLDCHEVARCPFYVDLKVGHVWEGDSLRKMYFECEQYDGYYRDQCVFSDKIDIEDSMNLVVGYKSGAKMSYSLNAFMPWEGYIVVFNGTRGRLEHRCEESTYISGDGSVPGALQKQGTWTRIYPHWKPAYEVEVWSGEGGHGGGDALLLQDVLLPNPPEDKYMRAADQRSGAWSVITGITANHSMAEGRVVQIDELISDIGMPDYPAMPTGDEPLPLREEAREG